MINKIKYCVLFNYIYTRMVNIIIHYDLKINLFVDVFADFYI